MSGFEFFGGCENLTCATPVGPLFRAILVEVLAWQFGEVSFGGLPSTTKTTCFGRLAINF